MFTNAPPREVPAVRGVCTDSEIRGTEFARPIEKGSVPSGSGKREGTADNGETVYGNSTETGMRRVGYVPALLFRKRSYLFFPDRVVNGFRRKYVQSGVEI